MKVRVLEVKGERYVRLADVISVLKEKPDTNEFREQLIEASTAKLDRYF